MVFQTLGRSELQPTLPAVALKPITAELQGKRLESSEAPHGISEPVDPGLIGVYRFFFFLYGGSMSRVGIAVAPWGLAGTRKS